MEKHVFDLMGVEIFRWSGYDPVDDTTDQYYDVEFILPELAYYRNMEAVSVTSNGDLEIYGAGGSVVKETFNIASLKSFRQKLEEIYGE